MEDQLRSGGHKRKHIRLSPDADGDPSRESVILSSGEHDEERNDVDRAGRRQSSETPSFPDSQPATAGGVELTKYPHLKKNSAQSLHFVGYSVEDHKQPIFGVAFNPHDKDAKVFATTGGNRVNVYHFDEALGKLKIVQSYVDSNDEEIWYTCAWSIDRDTSDFLLAVAGFTGIIKLLNLRRNRFEKAFIGHGKDVNELRFHPADSNIMLSASKDFSLRLWNVKTNVCIAVFGGEDGHRDEVLSADFHMSGNKLVSSGMDNAIKIWQLDTKEIQEAIADSYEVQSEKDKEEDMKKKRKRRVLDVQYPIFSSREIHRNYVDCVRWYGDAILSKSTDCCIILWCPDPTWTPKRREDGRVIYLQEFHFKECEIWYVRFCLSPDMLYLVTGNMKGRLYLWDMRRSLTLPEPGSGGRTPHARVIAQFTHGKCKTAVRQVSISPCGRFVASSCDDGSVWLTELR